METILVFKVSVLHLHRKFQQDYERENHQKSYRYVFEIRFQKCNDG